MGPGEVSWLSSLAQCIIAALLTVCSAAQLSQRLAENVLPTLCAFSILCGHVCLHDIVLTHTSCEQHRHRTVLGEGQSMCVAATIHLVVQVCYESERALQ